MLTDVLLYCGLGAVIGFLAGLLGVGGGGILVPALTAFFTYRGIGGDYSLQMAIATSLACMLPTTMTSTWSHHKKSGVAWSFVKWMALGTFVGSIIGANLALNISSFYIALGFAVFMGVTALQLFKGWQPHPNSKPISIISMIVAGGIIGTASALISVGAAFLSIMYLTYNNIDFKKAIGTSSAIGFFSVMFATINYLSIEKLATIEDSLNIGLIYIPAFILITITSILTTPIGVHVSHTVPNKLLKKILGILCLILSIEMLISTLG